MIIRQILNNSVVISDKGNEEIVVVGKGIGFHGKVGDPIDPAKIEKTFVLEDSNNLLFKSLLEEIPYEVIRFSIKAAEYIRRCSSKSVSNRLIVPLTDHIYSCLQRYREGIRFDKTLALNVRFLYKDEYKIATDVVDMLNSDFNSNVSMEEAAFLTLHIVNAQMDTDIEDIIKATDIVETSVNTVEEYFNIRLNSDDINFARFVTHLQFFAKRMITSIFEEDDLNLDMNTHINLKYPNEYACARLICDKIKEKYRYQIDTNEYTYLTIHIARLLR